MSPNTAIPVTWFAAGEGLGAGALGLVRANIYIWGVALPEQIQGLINDINTPIVYGQEETPAVPDTPFVDDTGKSHDDIPEAIPEGWTGDDIEHAIDQVMKSIDERKRQMQRFGEEPGHRERLRREEQYLRRLRNRQGGCQ